MKKIWVTSEEVWQSMGWVVLGLGCVSFICALIHWFQNPELSQMELFLETLPFQICGLVLALFSTAMVVWSRRGEKE